MTASMSLNSSNNNSNQDKTKSLITSQQPIMWAIAGADCSGGAGIAADIKTGHCLNVEVCHLITANTVQNSTSLISVNPVDVEILSAQADALCNDKAPRVIKIGLVVTIEQVQWLTELLTTLKANNSTLKVIYDPVGQASVGGKLSSLTLNDLTPLLSLVDIITPNAIEAQQLAGSQHTQVHELAMAIHQLNIPSVIIKGGHTLTTEPNASNTLCYDYCLHHFTDDEANINKNNAVNIEYGLATPRVSTQYSHGGGCSFASALACFIAQGHLLRDAFTLTKAFINQGLYKNINKVEQYGAFLQTPMHHQAQYFPEVNTALVEKYKTLPAFKNLGFQHQKNKAIKEINNSEQQDEKLGLYPVINSLYWLIRLLPLNLNIIQLRIKNKSLADTESIIQQAVTLTNKHNDAMLEQGKNITRLFINDYWQLAIKHNAYGVHIGQEDIINADLTQIQQAGLALGISTHGCYEFLLAQQLQPSYLAIGAIFPTKTKNMSGQIQGIETLTNTLNLATNIPIVAIGGITHEKTPAVWQTGVDSIAVVTAITEAENPESAVDEFKQLLTAN